MSSHRKPSKEIIRKLFRYDEASGKVFYRVSRGCRLAGARAGSIVTDGYRYLRFHGRHLPETHIIWVLMTGEWPRHTIDHIDRDVQNNRWANLREATLEQQTANTKLRATNKSGIRGVRWHERDKKWRASIKVAGREIYLGGYSTKEAAAKRYQEAAKARWQGFFNADSEGNRP